MDTTKLLFLKPLFYEDYKVREMYTTVECDAMTLKNSSNEMFLLWAECPFGFSPHQGADMFHDLNDLKMNQRILHSVLIRDYSNGVGQRECDIPPYLCQTGTKHHSSFY